MEDPKHSPPDNSRYLDNLPEGKLLNPLSQEKKEQHKKLLRRIFDNDTPDDKKKSARYYLLLLEGWGNLRPDLRNIIEPLIVQAVARNPTPPEEMIERMLQRIYDFSETLGIPRDPRDYQRNAGDSVPPIPGTDEYGKKVHTYAGTVNLLREETLRTTTDFVIAWDVWNQQKKTESAAGSTGSAISENSSAAPTPSLEPKISHAPVESGIRRHDIATDGADAETYERIRRGSGTMRRVLAGPNLPQDLIDDEPTPAEKTGTEPDSDE